MATKTGRKRLVRRKRLARMLATPVAVRFTAFEGSIRLRGPGARPQRRLPGYDEPLRADVSARGHRQRSSSAIGSTLCLPGARRGSQALWPA
jgi:hypothetical protein